MQNSYVNYHSRNMYVQMLFHGPSLTIVCQWGNFGRLLPYNLYPTAGYVLAQLDSFFKYGVSQVSMKFSL